MIIILFTEQTGDVMLCNLLNSRLFFEYFDKKHSHPKSDVSKKTSNRLIFIVVQVGKTDKLNYLCIRI